MIYRRERPTGGSGVLIRRCRSKPQVVGSRLDSALSFSHVDVGDAFQFKTRDRGFASRQRRVNRRLNVICTTATVMTVIDLVKPNFNKPL